MTNMKGKKYVKDNFRNQVTPAYLIHNSILSLRNALELMLACIDQSGIITGKMGEYAEEKPVKPRSYETQWAKLMGNTLNVEGEA